jgi:7,8-dihydroneopterin aldolase/epimerase/oxygenase
MAWIALEGMRFHAKIGVHDAEQVLGSEFVIDLYVSVPPTAGVEDDLSKTINYETIYHLCKLEMSESRKLIEHALNGIVKRMKHQFQLQGMRIRVRKLNPPVGGPVAQAWVEEEFDFMKECPSCKKKFILYDQESAWARHPNLHPASREHLERRFGGCICDNCMVTYVGKI